MLGVLGVISVGLLNASYFAAACYLTHVWAKGDQIRVRKYFNRFMFAWVIVVGGIFIYFLYF